MSSMPIGFSWILATGHTLLLEKSILTMDLAVLIRKNVYLRNFCEID